MFLSISLVNLDKIKWYIAHKISHFFSLSLRLDKNLFQKGGINHGGYLLGLYICKWKTKHLEFVHTPWLYESFVSVNVE